MNNSTSLDAVLDDARNLADRMRIKEKLVDSLILEARDTFLRINDALKVQEVETARDFDAFKREVGARPRSELLLGLAAENRALQQLHMEQRALQQALEEHECSANLVMQEFRSQKHRLNELKQVESHYRTALQTSSSYSGNCSANQQSPHNQQITSSENAQQQEVLSLMCDIQRAQKMLGDQMEMSDRCSAQLDLKLSELQLENSTLTHLLELKNEFHVASPVTPITLPSQNSQNKNQSFSEPPSDLQNCDTNFPHDNALPYKLEERDREENDDASISSETSSTSTLIE